MLRKEVAEQIILQYSQAWINQDPDAIIELFTIDAIYQEWAFTSPYKGHKEIKQYWIDKVVSEQSDIEFTLLNYYIDGNILIAEWEAKFYINGGEKKNHMIEVAILEIVDGKIKSLREYWANQVLK